jgi:hypothetical protein
MTERSNSTTEAVGRSQADEIMLVDGGRRSEWRPRWSVAIPRRPLWWEVPPHAACAAPCLGGGGRRLATRHGPPTNSGRASRGGGQHGRQQQLPQNNPWFGRLAVGWIMAVQFAARGIHRLGVTTEGADDPQRRRQVDMTAVGALACAVTLATAIGHLETSGEPAQRGFEQHLSGYGLRRSGGIWRPISDWWCGAPPAHPNGTAVDPGGNGAEAVVTTGDHPFLAGGHDRQRGTLASVDKGR